MTPLASALATARPVYEIPEQNLVGEVLNPAMAASSEVDIAVGFFSSHCLSQIAPGLASLIDRNLSCRLLVSPELSEEDREAIERGVSDPAAVVDSFMVELFRQPAGALAGYTADCLAYLVANGTLQIRCVLMERGMFHKKVWLLRDGETQAAVHGSGNLTARGLFVNGEQMTVDRPWMDGSSSATRVDELRGSFDLEWTNQKSDRLAIEPEQLIELLRGRARSSGHVPTVQDFWDAWVEDRDLGLVPSLPPGVVAPNKAKRLVIPEWLDWEHPPYAHQATAVAKLAERDFVGLLAMATGGGKTKTALICCGKLQEEYTGPLLVVILVPTRVLASQWADEVRDFGVSPILLSGMERSARDAALADVQVSLRSGDDRTEVLISTLQLFVGDQSIRGFVDGAAAYSRTVLIADEAHNFGSAGFISDPPENFDHRIGLSATPVRQYDADGTDGLFSYFKTEAEPAFTFSLSEAIKSGCLTPYNYHLHTVELSDEEMERYVDLTEQLRKAGFQKGDDGGDGGLSERQERLLRERRSLVEQTTAKIARLRELLAPRSDALQHTLIYCSAKAVLPPHSEKQIDLARQVLRDLRIDTHMYTSVETSRTGSQAFLEGFALGTYPVLLAMKVLDEGVDVPAAREAFLLASSTVEREWVQRRGRVLRKAPGKTHADLHDFLVVPPSFGDTGARGLLQAELRRAQHFAEDSANKYDTDGPIDVIRSIERQI
jgi:superfamily II DNA or RNA helicase